MESVINTSTDKMWGSVVVVVVMFAFSKNILFFNNDLWCLDGLRVDK